MISAVMPTYGRWDVAVDRGEGPYLYATDGRKFLDFTSGIAVTGLGHCHPHLVQIAEGDVVKTLHRRAEALEVSFVSGGGECSQSTAVERAVAADDAIALGMTCFGLVFARDLEGQLASLGTGITEEHGVGESIVDKALGQPLLTGNPEQVGGVP